MKFYIKTFLCLFLLMYFGVTKTADGDLDPTFNAAGSIPGTVMTTIPGHPDAAINGIYIQSDGKIVAVGNDLTTPDTDFVVARYLTDGNLDPLFGAGGIAVIPFGVLGTGIARGVAVQSDGKIVVAGTITTTTQIFAARLNANGTLDATFNGGAIFAVPNFGVGSNDQGNAVVVDLDGKVVIVGSSNLFMAVVRLNSNGSLDLTFNGTGKLTIQFVPGFAAAGFAVALDADGRTIYAAGRSAGGGTPPLGAQNFAYARIFPNGVIDFTRITLFSTDPDDLQLISSEVHAVLVQPDRKVVLIGFTDWLDENTYFALARYDSTGTLDPAFNGSQPAFNLNPGTFASPSLGGDPEISSAFAAALQEDGKIIAAGSGPDADNPIFMMLARYFSANGGLDVSFNGGGAPAGYVWTSASNSVEDQFNAVALQGDGKIVGGGYTRLFPSPFALFNFALARYLVDSPPVPLVQTTILAPTGRIFNTGIVTFTGTAENPSIVDLFLDTIPIGSTVTDPINGTDTWTFATGPIDVGSHTLRAVGRYRDDGHVNLETGITFVICPPPPLGGFFSFLINSGPISF